MEKMRFNWTIVHNRCCVAYTAGDIIKTFHKMSS